MPPDEFQLQELIQTVTTGVSRSTNWRRLQLNRVKLIIENHEEEILNALANDLSKPVTEAFFEIIALKQELALTTSNLKTWMRPKQVKVPFSLQPGKAKVISEPLGCVLIIGPWNYPFMLTIHPLISALAAGNTAVLKPSEHAPATSHLIVKLVRKYFPKDVVQALEGNAEFSENLLKNKFDHIFFTGGGEIGTKVMEAAAKNLTPVTLELGGTNPAIVLSGADIEITAKRIIWGKSINAGQTCLAPNYLLIEEGLAEELIDSMKKCIVKFYGEIPLNSKNLSAINKRQFSKVKSIISNSKYQDKIVFGGEVNDETQRIEPTLIELNSHSDPLIQEELFCPILPIVRIKDLNSAIEIVHKQEKPLAIYMFGGSKAQQTELLQSTTSGGVCFNDVIIQAAAPELPFGGVGGSGMGSYHGKAGFENFSHQKSILEKPFWLDLNFRYPPYKLDIEFIRKFFN